MKKGILLIILLVCAMLVPSCAGYTASAPGKPFSREDWDVCGFEPWTGIDELQDKFNAEDGDCGDSNDSWIEQHPFNGGSASISCHWLLGRERLYTTYDWTVAVTNTSAGVALPRGLYIGSSMEQVKNEFGLGAADGQGIYYGDENNTPYAMIKDIDYHNYKKEITLAVPAGETSESHETFYHGKYTCILKLKFDAKDSLGGFSYISLLKYSILPGLPEPEQVKEVRLFSIGKEEPERVLKFEDAIEVLGCIQNAGQAPVTEEVTPTHSIEVVSSGEVYTLKYGDGLIEAPDGKVYEIWDRNEDVLFESLPELCTYKYSYMRDKDYKAVELSAQQDEEIKRIIGSMAPCSDEASGWGRCSIFVDSGDGFDSYVYFFEAPYLRFKGNTYKISEEDSYIIQRIYNEAYGISEPEPSPEPPKPSPEVGSPPGAEESPAYALSGEPLLPGMPSPYDITDVLIWRIGEQGITYKWTPTEAEALFDIIQAGRDKHIEGELESPKYIILIRGGNRGYNYEITVGSNGIKALDGEGYQVVYDVVFPDYAAEKYFPENAWDPDSLYTAPPKGGFGEGCIHDPYNLVKNLINVKYFTEEQFSAVCSAVDDMTPCADAMPAGKFFAFSLALETEKNTEQWCTYEYYIGTNYVSYEVQGLVNKSLYKISEEDARTLTEVYTEIYTKCFSELL